MCHSPSIIAGVLPVQDDVGIRSSLTDTAVAPPIPPRSASSSSTPSHPPPLPPSLSSDPLQAITIPGSDARFVIEADSEWKFLYNYNSYIIAVIFLLHTKLTLSYYFQSFPETPPPVPERLRKPPN